MSNHRLIPILIVLAGALVAVWVAVSDTFSSAPHTVDNVQTAQKAGRSENPYVFGNPDAPVTIVEFSDFECPFCARLHPTLKQIVEESEGSVRWEYRHLPLPSHRNAELAALAGECVGRLGGNERFWNFAESAFSNQRSFSKTFFEQEAGRLGVDSEQFGECIRSEETKAIVENDFETGIAFGGRGTPFSVIVFEDGSTRPVSGALPYAQWISLLRTE